MTFVLDTSFLAISMPTGGKPFQKGVAIPVNDNLHFRQELHSTGADPKTDKNQIECSFTLVFCFGLF